MTSWQRLVPALVCVLAAMTLLTELPASVQAQSSATISVTGALVNGTVGAPVPSGVAVLLHRFGAASSSVDTFETVTDSDGAFRFDGVPLPAEGDSLALAADYGETRYTQLISPSMLSQPLTLPVYEFTRDVDVVRVVEQTIIATGTDAATRRLALVQLFVLENRSDTTLVPDLSAPPMIGQFSFLRFSVPEGATDLEVSTDLVGGEVIPVGTGFAITAPVQPGLHQVTFSFTAPYDGAALTWRDNTLQGADSLLMLVPVDHGDITVGGLTPAEPVTVEGATYRVWGAADLAPGEGVDLTLSGLPEPTWVTRLGNPLSEARFWYRALPVLVGLFFGSLLVWALWRRPAAGVV